MVTVTIRNGSQAYEPIIEGMIKYSTNRRGECSKVTFSYVNDGVTFPEGSSVDISDDGKGIFYGWLFTKSQNKDALISCTAYDQIRYLMNENSYSFENMSLDGIIRKIINDYSGGSKLMRIGKLADTGCKLNLVEENCKLLDMIEDGIDDTLRSTNQLYILYDNYGKLYLDNARNMRYEYIVDSSNADDFTYQSTIDDNAYNTVFVTYTDKDDNMKYVSATNSSLIQKWGLLTRTEDASDSETAQQIANLILSNYGRPYKTLTISGVVGDFAIRGGASVIVNLPVEDMDIKQYMMVDTVTHTFNEHNHTMDLKLIGGAFKA